MKNFILVTILLSSIVFSQSLQELNSLTNKNLDEIRLQLKNEIGDKEDKNIKDANDMEKEFDEVVINPMKIEPEPEYDFEDNYGYDYFQREINFFDNVPAPKDYLLGSGDEISISIWGETNLTKNFRINKDGLIFF